MYKYQFNYRPEIDGLRFIAVLFVILYLNHKALTIAAKVNGKPSIVIPASRFIIKSLFFFTSSSNDVPEI